MLSKVSKRVRRPSLQDTSIALEPRPQAVECAPDLLRWSDFANPFPQVAPGGYSKYYALVESRARVVDSAPDLLRWSDFTNPFPTVAPGGYSKYYAEKIADIVIQAPNYCPVLSHFPDPSGSDIPPASPLFSSAVPKLERWLTVIREVSTESMTPKKPTILSVSTTTAPTQLRRKRRQLLRTPSIERDFAADGRYHLELSLSISDTSSLLGSPSLFTHSHSPSSHSGHSDSNHSDSTNSGSHNSLYPITPSTSIDSGDEGNLRGEGQLRKQGGAEEIICRPDSWTSFNTAKSGFSDT